MVLSQESLDSPREELFFQGRKIALGRNWRGIILVLECKNFVVQFVYMLATKTSISKAVINSIRCDDLFSRSHVLKFEIRMLSLPFGVMTFFLT